MGWSNLSPFFFSFVAHVEGWASAVKAGRPVIAFSVPEADLPALNQKKAISVSNGSINN